MAKRKRATFRVVMEPEGGGVHPRDPNRRLIRIMEVYAYDEAGAREYAIESALAESENNGSPIYQVVSIDKV